MPSYDEMFAFALEYAKMQGPLTYTELRDAIIFKFFRETWDQAENILEDLDHAKFIVSDVSKPSKSINWVVRKI